MKSLCQLYHCDASNVTGIVDGLENKGLVSRQNDPHDRRIKVLQIEPAGKKLQLKMIEELHQANGFLFDPLTPDEKQHFIRIVEKLAKAKDSSITAS